MNDLPSDAGSFDRPVVVLGQIYPDSFADNISLALQELGVAVIEVDPFRRLSRRPRMREGRLTRPSAPDPYARELTKRSRALRAALVDRPVDRLLDVDPGLVISTQGHFVPEQIARWRRRTPGAVWVLWYPDSIVNLGAHDCLIAGYDHLFFKDPYIVELLRGRTAVSAHFLPEACNPTRHYPQAPREPAERSRYKADVALAGNMYSYRALVLEHLPTDVDLKIYGSSYPDNVPGGRLRGTFVGEYVHGRTKALAYSGAKIVLNTLHYGEVRGVNARLFEATACGGFVLTHHAPELESYFVPGEEVAVFDSSKELCDAVLHYLEADHERRTIAAAGQRRAHQDHTYTQRLNELFCVCGLLPPWKPRHG